MKLLMCGNCGDIFNLTMQWKTCGCAKTGGRYIDELNAEYIGEAQPIGFANSSFIKALKLQRIEDKHELERDTCCNGQEFKAFMIPKVAKTIKKI